MRHHLQPARIRLSRHRGVLLSFAAHALVLLPLVSFAHRSVRVAPLKLPGTRAGLEHLLYFAPGGPEHAANDLAAKAIAPARATRIPRPLPSAPPPPPAAKAPATEAGLGSAGESGLGEGDISLALLKHFPHPAPDLSTLPHGTTGDVVLDAVIDEHGNIRDLTLVKGLGSPIDDQVIAVVRQWTYSPATRNGSPVRSEQELHFHYEKA